MSAKWMWPCRGCRAGSRWHLPALALLLGASEVCYVAMVRLNAVNGVRPVAIFLLLMGLLFGAYAAVIHIIAHASDRGNGLLLPVAIGALLFRLTLLWAGLPHGPIGAGPLQAIHADAAGQDVAFEHFLVFDDDIWRYLWDGHVWSAGVNPYRYAPSDSALDRLANRGDAWPDIRSNINHPWTPTIYPPLAMALFRVSHGLAPGSILVMKGLLMLFDLAACGFVALALHAMGRSPALAAIYAWNPLVLKAFSASGHVDALMAAMLAACAYFLIRNRRGIAALAFSAAVLAKIAPVVLFPAIVRRIGVRYTAIALAAIAAGYLPFADGGWHLFTGLATFGREWEFNAGVFSVVRFLMTPFFSAPGDAARGLSGVAIVGLVCWSAWRDEGVADRFAGVAATVLGFSILLGPVVMPWYIAAVLPFAAISGERIWIWCSALVLLAFLVMVDGRERTWALALEYGILALVVFASRRDSKENQHELETVR